MSEHRKPGADPLRPYKAYAAALAAAITAALAFAADMPQWLVIFLTALAAGLGAFVKGNPDR